MVGGGGVDVEPGGSGGAGGAAAGGAVSGPLYTPEPAADLVAVDIFVARAGGAWAERSADGED